MFNKSPIDIDRPMYDNIPKDIALFIETEAQKFQSMKGVARKAATGLYNKLMGEYRDFANYLIGMYGQVNIGQEKKIADLTLYNQEMAKKVGEYQQVQIDTAGKIIELKKDLQDRTDACRRLTDRLVLQKEQQEGRGKRISDPVNDKAPIKAMRRMVITVTEREDGTSNVTTDVTNLGDIMIIGILDTLRVKYVGDAAKKFTEVKDPA